MAQETTAVGDRPESSAAAPVAPGRRIGAMDAARGLALLGIFIVNIQTFAEPFGSFQVPEPEAGGWATGAAFYFNKILCEGKFYPLFSMLFGMGLIAQMRSVEAAGRRFLGLYARRLVFLCVLGLSHALLLWYGDILFVYSICGAVLMLCARARAKVLLGVGIGLLGLATLVGTGLSAMGALAIAQREEAQAAWESGEAGKNVAQDDWLDRRGQESPFWGMIDAYRDQRISGGPEHPLVMGFEERAYRDGPWSEIFLFRAYTWLMYMVFCVLGFGWHVLGMFFVGAGLMKSGLFAPEGRRMRARLAAAGLVIGLPGATLAALLPAMDGGVAGFALSGLLTFSCGPLVSLLYLSVIAIVAEAGAARPALWALGCVGRMALTNYLMQTLIATTIFYSYGFAQFGQWTRPERLGLVFAVYAAQCIISPLWLSVFRFGPMEWVWRSSTYGRLQPMRRGSAEASRRAGDQ